MESSISIKDLPITSYFLVINPFKKEILELKFLSYGKYTKTWDKLNINAINYIDKNDFFKEIEELKKAKAGDVLFLTHKFYEKDKKHFLYIKVRLKILKIENNNYYCIGVNEDISKEKENETIVNNLKNSPHIGFAIYLEKFIYVNDYLKNLVKLPNNIDYRTFSPFDFIKYEEDMNTFIQLRKEGINKPYFKENEKIITFLNERKYINFYADTVYFNKKFAGMVLVVDITDKIKQLIFSKFLNEIGKIRLELFTQNKYTIKNFLNSLKIIFEKEYEVYINFSKFKCGNKEVEFEKEIEIINKDKKSFLCFKFETGEIILKSDYFNEFEEKFLDIYEEIKNTIKFTFHSIRQHLLVELLKIAIEKSFQWVIITDEKGEILYANDTVEKLSKFSKEEIIGKTPKIFKSGAHDEIFYKELWDHLNNNQVFETDIINKTKDGSFIYLRSKYIPIILEDEKFYVALGVDITKEKELQTKLYEDELTKLLNKRGLLKVISNINTTFYLLIIDIKNFKSVNQIEGIDVGDLLLQHFSKFLETFFRSEDLIARIGSDEFAIVIKDINETDLKKLLKEFLEKVKKLNIRVNIGIAKYPEDAANIKELIEKAYLALELAKKEEENSYEFYHTDIQKEISKLYEERSLILDALKNDKFEFFFQPYIDLREEKIKGVEALIRIVDKDKIYTPFHFIDYAEKSGLIIEIEEIMFKKLLFYYEQIKLPISINLSAKSFKYPHHILNLQKLTHIPLNIEITEREVAKEIEKAKKIFELIHSFGFKISIDDFGTGYSNLAYIKNLDFDLLKIDMEFIKNITNNKKDLALVKTMILLAKELNYYTIAEGVETKEQVKLLKEIGCNAIQGYLISPPLSIEEIKKFLKDFRYNY